jgi:hypothetical protein
MSLESRCSWLSCGFSKERKSIEDIPKLTAHLFTGKERLSSVSLTKNQVKSALKEHRYGRLRNAQIIRPALIPRRLASFSPGFLVARASYFAPVMLRCIRSYMLNIAGYSQ